MGRGYANSKRLQFSDEGVSGLTHYITKDDASYKRWSGSRNLVQPEAATSDGKLTMDEIEELAGPWKTVSATNGSKNDTRTSSS